MFHEKLFRDARSITNSLMTRNVRMVPKTPELNNIVSGMLFTVNDNNAVDNNMPLGERSDIFERELSGPTPGVGLGNAEEVSHLTALMKTNLLITRSYALPLIQAITATVENAVRNNDKEMFGNNGINIVGYFESGLFSNEIDAEPNAYNTGHWATVGRLVSEYANSTFSSPPPRPKYIDGSMTSQEISEFLKTGIENFDTDVYNHFVRNHPDKTEAAWQVLFATPTEGEFEANTVSNENDFLHLIFGFLFCRGINRDNIPDNVSMGLDDYLREVSTYKVYLGKVIHDYLDKVNRQQQTGYMKLNESRGPDGVKRIEIDPKALHTLLGDEYPEVTIETFIGCALSNEPEWFMDVFLENTAKYNLAYAQDRSSRLESVLNGRRNVIRGTVLAKVDEIFTDSNTINIEGKDEEVITFTFKENKRADLGQYVTDLTMSVSDDIVGHGDVVNDAILKVVTDVVCNYLLEGTMVNELVTRIMLITKANPDCNTNHAGMLSVISILVDYMLGQIDFQLDFSRKVANPTAQSYFL